MLPIAMLGFICTSPGQTFGVSLFNDSFRDALGISLATLSTAYMLGTLTASLAMPMVGHLMDRFGIRRTMAVVVFLFGLACMYTSLAANLFMLFTAFVFLRMLGQGSLGLLSQNTVAFWFHRRLGLASGLCNIGMAGAFALVPNLNVWLIRSFGWRWAYTILGVGVWVILLPLLAIFYRNRPEDLGQQPDGARVDTPLDAQASEEMRRDFTLREAARTGLFWTMALATASWAMIGTAMIFHVQPIFAELGVSGGVSVMFLALGVTLAVTQLVGGILADIVRPKFLLALSLAGITASAALLCIMTGPWLPLTFGVLMGVAQGLIMAISNPIWTRNYGRANIGKIRGSLAMLMVAASSLGPFVAGLGRDLFDTFRPVLILFALLPLPLVVAAMLVRRPVYPPPTRA